MKKKLILIVFVGLNVFLCVALAGMIILSETYPFRPGTAFYGVQDAAEQWRLRLGDNDVRRTELALELAERRLADLARAETPSRLQAATTAFDGALNEAVWRIDATPVIQQDELLAGLDALLVRAEIVVAALEPGEGDSIVTALSQKIEAMEAARSAQDIVALVPPKNTLLEAIAIPFLSEDVDHDLYPLTGGHAEVECEACHPTGEYSDTPTACGDCHPLPVDYVYPDHFEGSCEDCHDDVTWTPFEFDHAGITDCQSCHQVDNPPEHYARPDNYWSLRSHLADDVIYVQHPSLPQISALDGCASCHPSTTDWNDSTFDHAGFSDCESCHLEEDNPENHYEGPCASCHGTTDWELTRYDHDGVVECRSCHLEKDNPERHYEGPCATCHGTSDWELTEYDHDGVAECRSCHLEDSPPEHYAHVGQHFVVHGVEAGATARWIGYVTLPAPVSGDVCQLPSRQHGLDGCLL